MTRHRYSFLPSGEIVAEEIVEPEQRGDLPARAGRAGAPIHGWRVWYTRPAERQLSLYSAVYGAPNQHLRKSMCRIQSRDMDAECSVHGHAPPPAGCACGIYGVTNVLDAVYRYRAMAANIQRGDGYNCWFPYGPARGMVPVLARCTFRRAVAHDDVATWAVLSDVRGQIDVATPVLRAGSARIERVFVTDGLAGDGAAARELADRLGAALDVDGIAGLPRCTGLDWEQRPEWMRLQPWNTRYQVDRLLSGLTLASPLHVAFVCQGNICRSPMAEAMFRRRLRDRGLDPALPAMRALGVPPLLAHLGGSLSREEAVARAKAETRAYAKRQATFARHQLAGFTPVAPEEGEAALDGFARP